MPPDSARCADPREVKVEASSSASICAARAATASPSAARITAGALTSASRRRRRARRGRSGRAAAIGGCPSPRMPPSPREAPSSFQLRSAPLPSRRVARQPAGAAVERQLAAVAKADRDAARPGTSRCTDSRITSTSPIAPIARPRPSRLERALPPAEPRGQPAAQQQRRRARLGDVADADRAISRAAPGARAGRRGSRCARARASSAARRGRRRSGRRAGAGRGAARRRHRGPRRSPAARTARCRAARRPPASARAEPRRRVVRSVITSGSTIDSRCSRWRGAEVEDHGLVGQHVLAVLGRRIGGRPVATASIVARPSVTAQTIVREAW